MAKQRLQTVKQNEEAQKKQLDTAKTQIDQGETALSQAEMELEEGRAAWEDANNLLNTANGYLRSAKSTLENALKQPDLTDFELDRNSLTNSFQMLASELDLSSAERAEYENAMNQLLDDYENGNISERKLGKP